jgi:PhnB protein
MRSISPYLNFNGTTEEAFDFYRSVFGGEFSAKTRYRDMPDGDKLPENEKDRIMHMALPLKNGALYGSDSLDSRGPRITAGNSVYIMIAPESEEEARNIYEALSAGGEIEMALSKMFWGDLYASFKDRYGIWWMIDYEYPKSE